MRGPVDLLGHFRLDTVNGAEQVHGVERAAEAFQLCPTSGGDEFADGGGNTLADRRQSDQAGLALLLQNNADIGLEL